MIAFSTGTARNVLLALVLHAQVFLALVLLTMCHWYLCFSTLLISRDKHCQILLHVFHSKGIYSVLSLIWKCCESGVFGANFLGQKAVGATFFAFCNYAPKPRSNASSKLRPTYRPSECD